MTAARDVVGAASDAASLVMGMLNPNTLGYREDAEDCTLANMIAANRGQMEAADARRAELEAKLPPDEKLLRRTYLAAISAGQTDAAALGAMGLQRDSAGQVVRVRELQPVERRRLR
jgi:hypothetical protein